MVRYVIGRDLISVVAAEAVALPVHVAHQRLVVRIIGLHRKVDPVHREIAAVSQAEPDVLPFQIQVVNHNGPVEIRHPDLRGGGISAVLRGTGDGGVSGVPAPDMADVFLILHRGDVFIPHDKMDILVVGVGGLDDGLDVQ